MSLSKPSRNYMVTVFFPDSDAMSEAEQAFYWAAVLDEVFSDPIYKYACINIEVCPHTGRVHWQGYVECIRPARYTQLQRSHPVFATAHYEPRLGTQEEAISYCSKVDSRHPDARGPYTWGVKAVGQGHRSDIDDLTALVVQGKSTREIAETMPGMYMRYYNGIAALQAAIDSADEPETDFQPRPWQQKVLDTLSAEPDDRTIYWVTDAQGGQGKTRLATHLIRNYGGIELSGKMADMTYAYSQGKQRVVIFDISRAAADMTGHIYSMAEKLKCGRLMNTKYQSRMVTFRPPHVIIFSNSTWDREKFSHDRVKETVLQPVEHRFM